MNIPQIQIHQTNGWIEIKQNPAKQSITQPAAELNTTQKPAVIDIQTDWGELHIDQSAAFAEEGLKKVVDLSKEFAEQGKQAVLEFIHQVNSDGDQLARINGPSVIDIVADHVKPKTLDFNVGLSHQTPISVTYRPGKQTIRVELGGAFFRPVWNPPRIEVQQGAVEIRVVQQPSIQIDVKR